MDSASSWIYWAFLSAVFAAATALFAKIGVESVDSDMATWIRTLIVLIVLFTYVRMRGRWMNPFLLPSKTWLFLALSGVATGASWVCYFRAMKMGDASKVAAVDKLSLMLVAVLAFLFLGERLSARNWLGVLLTAIGIALLSLK